MAARIGDVGGNAVVQRNLQQITWKPYLTSSPSRTPTVVTKELAVWNPLEYPYGKYLWLFLTQKMAIYHFWVEDVRLFFHSFAWLLAPLFQLIQVLSYILRICCQERTLGIKKMLQLYNHGYVASWRANCTVKIMIMKTVKWTKQNNSEEQKLALNNFLGDKWNINLLSEKDCYTLIWYYEDLWLIMSKLKCHVPLLELLVTKESKPLTCQWFTIFISKFSGSLFVLIFQTMDITSMERWCLWYHHTLVGKRNHIFL